MRTKVVILVAILLTSLIWPLYKYEAYVYYEKKAKEEISFKNGYKDSIGAIEWNVRLKDYQDNISEWLFELILNFSLFLMVLFFIIKNNKLLFSKD